MAFARGKITAGLLGLSLCGLAAVASSTGRAGSPLGCHKTDDPKTDVTPVKVSELPTSPPVSFAVIPVASPPPVDIAPPSIPAIELPKLPGVTPSVTPQPVGFIPPTVDLDQIQAPAIPPVTVPNVGATPPVVVPSVGAPLVSAPALPPPSPTAIPPLVVPDPAPAKQAPVVPNLPSASPVFGNPAPADGDDSAPNVTKAATGVKVVVTLNGSQPTLTVLTDGAEMLTISCEQLDLAARGPGDDSVSAIKATGKVQFQAPGCRGTCDELVINPKTWDGTMFKNVRVTCRQGTGESELTAEKMVFKLRGGKETILSTVPAGHLAPARKE